MSESTIAVYRDVSDFKQAVEAADNLQFNRELKGAPRGCTIQDLVEQAEAGTEIVVSKRTPYPLPIGASFVADDLHDAVTIIRTFGTRCIEEFEEQDDETVRINYHFD